jgi:hypothetical protein
MKSHTRSIHAARGITTAITIATAIFTATFARAAAPADITHTLRAQLDSGQRTINIPAGDHLLGPLALPEGARLIFDHNARITPDTDAIKKQQSAPPRAWLTIEGDHVTIENLAINFSIPSANIIPADPATHDRTYYGVHPADAPFVAPPLPPGTREINAEDLAHLIRAKGRADLRITGLRALRTQSDWHIQRTKDVPARTLGAINLENCSDVHITDCRTSHLHSLVIARNTSRLIVRDNLATHGRYMTSVNHGSEWLLHTGNRTRYIVDQCSWWGGDAHAGGHGGKVPADSAAIVKRGLLPGAPGYSEHTTGVYDVSILGNQAEYGRTLAWGSKARNVLMSDNIARYMTDMAYDTEGTGKVVIANNIAINSTYYGIGCYFRGDSISITGNLVLVEPDGDPKFQGSFLRLHSANTNRFGNRRVHITGNQFIAREGKPRALTIEACADVNITANKIVNGRIHLLDISEELTLVANEIVNDLPGNYSALQAAPGIRRLFVKDNIFRRLANEDAPLAAEAALVNIAGRSGLRIIENNTIEGWKYAAWTGAATGSLAATLVFRNNTLSGELLGSEKVDSKKFHISGNLDLRTLEPARFRPATEEERKARPPAPKRPVDPIIENAPTE